MLGKLPDRVLSASYKYDVEQLGMSENAFRQDFILNSIFRRNPQDKLSMVSQYTGSYTVSYTHLDVYKRQLPFVSVYFKNTQIGTTTGFDGRFALESKKATDTVVASYIGFVTSYIPIQRNRFQTLDIKLQPERYELSGVVIRPGENPAEILLRKIINHKPLNLSLIHI